MTSSKLTRGWVAINALGAGVYLYFASSVWPPAELRGLSEGHAAGDPIVWGLTALPTFVACAAVNAGVLVWSGWSRLSRGFWRVTSYAWFIPVIWGIAYAIDFLHE